MCDLSKGRVIPVYSTQKRLKSSGLSISANEAALIGWDTGLAYLRPFERADQGDQSAWDDASAALSLNNLKAVSVGKFEELLAATFDAVIPMKHSANFLIQFLPGPYLGAG